MVLIDNGGFGSIGGLSESLGSGGFGTRYRGRGADGQLSGPPIRVDFAQNARSLGAHVISTRSIAELRAALAEAKRQPRTTVVTIETDREARVAGYESWWDSPSRRGVDEPGRSAGAPRLGDGKASRALLPLRALDPEGCRRVTAITFLPRSAA